MLSIISSGQMNLYWMHFLRFISQPTAHNIVLYVLKWAQRQSSAAALTYTALCVNHKGGSWESEVLIRKEEIEQRKRISRE